MGDGSSEDAVGDVGFLGAVEARFRAGEGSLGDDGGRFWELCLKEVSREEPPAEAGRPGELCVVPCELREEWFKGGEVLLMASFEESGPDQRDRLGHGAILGGIEGGQGLI